MSPILFTLLLTLTPIAELRGGIPLGISYNLDPKWLIPTCIVLNSLVYLPYRYLLDRGFSRFKFIQTQVDRVHKRGQKYIDRFGFWGMVIFVGIPLPFTGVYTGTLLAWIFKLDYKRSYLAMLLGCVMAGSIVAGIILLTSFTLPKLF